MTEEEAKTKWCPFARVAVEYNQYVSSANRGLAKDEAPHSGCIASACMAWRWLPAVEVQSKLLAIRDYRDKHGCDLATAKTAVEESWSRPGPTEGFCGLAGRPQ